VTTARRVERKQKTAPVLVSKPLHGRFKGWAREKGLKLGWATEKAIEQFMAESTGGVR
jgi:hypothetical protein